MLPISKKLVLLGGGGHCKSVLDTLFKTKEYSEIVITDPQLPAGSEVMGCKVAGDDSILSKMYEEGFTNAFITAGDVGKPNPRAKLAEMAQDIGFSFPCIIDPTAQVSPSAQIGDGTFVGKNSIINTGVRIGKHCIINTGTIVEHESIVGDYCHISTGSILCGEVTVGDESFIGAGTTIIQCVRIGCNVVVGAGSTVLSDVEDNVRTYGIVRKNRGVQA